MIDLDSIAQSCLTDAAYDMKVLDVDALREAAREQAESAADNATIYYHHCQEVIERYEREVGSEAEEIADGEEFKASDWQKAMSRYAWAIADCWMRSRVEDHVRDIEEAADDLAIAADDWGCEDTDEIRVSSDCPHGWAAHDKEDRDGVHFWSEPNLEGCRAVAVQAAGLWLSLTWTPVKI